MFLILSLLIAVTAYNVLDFTHMNIVISGNAETMGITTKTPEEMQLAINSITRYEAIRRSLSLGVWVSGAIVLVMTIIGRTRRGMERV